MFHWFCACINSTHLTKFCSYILKYDISGRIFTTYFWKALYKQAHFKNKRKLHTLGTYLSAHVPESLVDALCLGTHFEQLKLKNNLSSVHLNKEDKLCTSYRLWNTFHHGEANVTLELSECLQMPLFSQFKCTRNYRNAISENIKRFTNLLKFPWVKER